MKISSPLYILTFLALASASAQQINCPPPKELAKEIVEAELNGAWLTGPSKCQNPSSDIVLPKIHERLSAPVQIACENVPYRFLEFKELEKDVFKFSVNLSAINSDSSCRSIAPSEIIFRIYKGKSLNFFKSCVGVLSIPQAIVVRKDCFANLESREPQSAQKKTR